MSKISIFVCMPGNKECARVDSQIYVPVYGGNALQRGKDSGIAGDDTGDNISAKNPGYCEETVLYWAWKNRRADYYGFCHYRRYFDFAEEKHEKDCYGNIIEKYINEESVSKYGLKSLDFQ